MITSDMQAIVESSKLGFVATTRADGSPNLSPKGSIRVHDGHHLVFADIASPGTIDNLRSNPRIEINCVDFLKRRGYRFSGVARIIDNKDDDPIYQSIADWLLDTHGPLVPAQHAVLVRVEHASAVASPAYTNLGAVEDDLVTSWTTTYTGRDPHQAAPGGSQ